MQTISTFLWFDGAAEEAMNQYVSILGGKVLGVQRQGPGGPVMGCSFELRGQSFIALNGGPHFKFNEAVSLEIDCKDQAEIDYYWEKLGAGGDPKAQQCGWLKDKFGVSWQVVPLYMNRYFNDPDDAKSERVMEAMLKMKKLYIAALEKAYGG